jgi:hypothetical protein
LTLPTYFEVLSTQSVSATPSIFGTFLGLTHLVTQSLERFFRLPQMSRVLNYASIRVGVEVSQPNIQSNSLTRWRSFFNPFNVKAKLNVVAIGTTDNPNSFNLIQLIEVQITGSPDLETSRFEAISEGDNSPIFRQLVSCGLVFHRTMCLMLLKSWETFLFSLLLTVVVEPSDRRPSPFSRSTGVPSS